MSETDITIMHASLRFGDKLVLKDITVDLSLGNIIGIIGPSGAGKTTLIRALVGRQHLDEGAISIFGLKAGSRQLRSRMGYMTQELSVYSDLTVDENLRYFATMYGVLHHQIKVLITNILKTTDMTKQRNQLVSSLSGGQKQRVSLAITLIGSPELLILDEPTVGLDPVLREQLWKLFHELADKGTTILISSHVMDEAERCDNLLLMRDGSLLAHGSPSQLTVQTHTSSIEKAFLALVGEKV